MLEKIKGFPLVKFFYKLPGLVWFYHFLWAILGAVFCGFPGRDTFVVGITGTKGKTTTLELLNAILEAAGKKTALLSSLRVKIGDRSEKNKLGNSMPGRAYIQRFLRRAVRAGCQYALIEVTSQGVVLSRHRFVNWNAGVLTNVAPEHIESHGSFEKYRKAKLDFLRYVGEKKGKVIINKKDENAGFFLDALERFRPAAYSGDEDEVVRLLPKLSPHGSAAGVVRQESVLSGFNRDNVAAAVAIIHDIGIGDDVIEEALQHFRGVPGRMEFVQRGPFAVVVDYAHTPDSLKKVYTFLRATCDMRQATRLICVLGAAGGGRDKWKRPEMGKIAAEYCDEIILTNEDPYDEDPLTIINQIEEGVRVGLCSSQRQSTVHKLVDRREAIKKAISLAKDGDVVILTGKGSEEWIHVGKGKKIPWDERKIVEEVLCEKQKGAHQV